MTKNSAKGATVLINGYIFSTLATVYDATTSTNPVEITGFTEPVKNYIPSLYSGAMSLTMFWDKTTGGTWDILRGLTTGNVTVLPEPYLLGGAAISLPYLQSNFTPKGTVDGVIEVGQINFENTGIDLGVEYGVALANGTITATTTGTGVLDVDNAAVTKQCGGILHVWTKTTTDTYVIKIQDSSDNISYNDLITFVADGKTLLSERITVPSGVVDKYRRIVATRTGVAADPLGFTVTFYRDT